MFKYLIQPKIDKDFILSKINQESIMQYYTGNDVTSKKLVTSCLRSDNHVTCGYYKSKSGVLYMHDFATGEHLDCWNLVMKMFNVNYYQALEIIAKDFCLVESNIVKTKPVIVPEIKETESAKIQVQIKDYTEKELEWWKSFGISKKTLKKYHVFSIQHVFLNGELKFSSTKQYPIYGYYFGKDRNKQELWKIYFPLSKKDSKQIRFLNNLPVKKLQGYKQLKDFGNILVITKSQKDCMCFYEFGINAVAPSSESTFCLEEQINEFKKRFTHIIVMYDQDKAGKHNMYKIRLKYPELDYFVIPSYLNAKDFSDLVKLYSIERTKSMLNECLNYFKEKWKG